MTYRVGIDIGGTFTDFALLKGSEVVLHKNLSTPEDRSIGVMEGLAKLAEIEGGLSLAEIARSVLIRTPSSPPARRYSCAWQLGSQQWLRCRVALPPTRPSMKPPSDRENR